MQSDFISATELASLTGFKLKSIHNWNSTGAGPLAPILVKLGGRLGCWRADYDLWVQSQRKLNSSSRHLSAA
jgi:predicted DNA-binding transcriptional regulator AlpA